MNVTVTEKNRREILALTTRGWAPASIATFLRVEYFAVQATLDSRYARTAFPDPIEIDRYLAARGLVP